jgi:hypothetical protein
MNQLERLLDQLLSVFRSSNDTSERALGQTGRWLLSPGQTANGTIYAVKAAAIDVTYFSGCIAREGQAPSSGQVVTKDTTDLWPASRVIISAGLAWIYGKIVTIS